MSSPHHAYVIAELEPISALLFDLGERFNSAGFEIALVGGPVRDALIGRRNPTADLDFTTSARPEQMASILDGFASSVWGVGIRFGTIGARIAGRACEITTYRSEHYDRESRKPTVEFGDSLLGDLARRDFTVNSMALRLPTMELIDPFHGAEDVEEYLLRTPGQASDSFSDDPLRIMRAARFVSQFGFRPTEDVVLAMTELAERITIVSAERIREEFMKILMAPDPRSGLTLLVDTGVADWVLPELSAMRLTEDEHHRHKDVYEHSLTVLEQAIGLEKSHVPATGPDDVLRLAALLHDIGKPKTRRFETGGKVSFHHHEVVGARMVRKRMQAMRFSNDMIDSVSHLVELHLRFHGYGTGEWTDSAVRRYVRDAGDQIIRLHKLTRADCTTRNKSRALALKHAYDGLESRIDMLSTEEELAAIRPDLDGAQIMGILGITPGPTVGEAYRFLMDLRMEQGPLGEEQSTQALLAWWAAREQ